MSDPGVVHVIDDDPSMRRLIQATLESADRPVRLHESAEQFLTIADLKQPGCIVLDLRMPGMGGIELLKRLSDARNDMPVIVMSGHADVPVAVQSLKLGAVDFLPKPVEPTALLEAIARALVKSVELSRQRDDQEAIRRRISTLTPRELELLKLAVAGKSNKEIAAALNISIKTVDNHRASLKTKLQANSAADLVRMSVIAAI